MSEETIQTPTPPTPPPPEVVTTSPSSLPEPPRRRRSGSATAGIVLIFVGLVFLVGRLVPGVGWWNLWPFIIMIAGVVQAFTPGKEGWSVARLFDGLTTVAIGGVFLAIVSGVVGWGVWGTILSLWPVLVIAIGLDLLGKALNTSWFKVLGSLLVIAALAYAVSLNATGGSGITWYSGEVRSAEISEPVSGVQEATLLVESGVSEVELSGGRRLVEATGETPFGDPVFSVERDSKSADVHLSLGGGNSVALYPGGPMAHMTASISKAVLWDIEVVTGVSSFSADLRDVPVRSFVLKPGIAECEVILGDAPEDEEGTVDVKAGISTVVVRVPEDAQVRVESESGLADTNIADGIERVGSGQWETDGFERARSAGKPVWIVRVKSGIGSFTVDTY